MIEVAFAVASPRWQIRLAMHVPAHSTVQEVLSLAQHTLAQSQGEPAQTALREAPWQDGACGIYGERVERDHRLTAHDRVELYLPLQADPKLERRRRAEKLQTAKARNPMTVKDRR